MPGPFSAPNGQRSLLDPVVRNDLAKKNSLRTGKSSEKPGAPFRKSPKRLSKGLRRRLVVIKRQNNSEHDRQAGMVG